MRRGPIDLVAILGRGLVTFLGRESIFGDDFGWIGCSVTISVRSSVMVGSGPSTRTPTAD